LEKLEKIDKGVVTLVGNLDHRKKYRNSCEDGLCRWECLKKSGMIVASNANGTGVVATYQTDTTDDDMISRKEMKDMNGPLDPLHECVIVF